MLLTSRHLFHIQVFFQNCYLLRLLVLYGLFSIRLRLHKLIAPYQREGLYHERVVACPSI